MRLKWNSFSIFRKGVFGLNVIGLPVCNITGGVIRFIGEYFAMLLSICGKHSKMKRPEVYFPICVLEVVEKPRHTGSMFHFPCLFLATTPNKKDERLLLQGSQR